MRIISRLQVTSTLTIVALAILVPVLIWSFSAFKGAKSDYVLADAIKANFFERASIRDQYFLYRESRAQEQWEKNNQAALALLEHAQEHFQSQEELALLAGMRQDTDASTIIFQRIVNNTATLQSSQSNRRVYEELDRRLFSQLLLRGSSIRDAASTLKEASNRRIEAAYIYLTIVIGMFAAILASATLLTSIQLVRLIRRRLAPLHQGAKAVTDGNLDYRIACEGNDEFTELGQSINAMTDKLQGFTRQLETEVSTHKQLAEMLRKLSIAVEQSPVTVVITDLDARIQYVNPKFTEVSGYSPAEAIGQTPNILKSSQTPRKIYDELWDRLSQGQTWKGELLNKRKNGELYWEETQIAPVKNPQGTVTHYVAVKTDITERKTAEAQLHLAANVFTHAREGIMITGIDGTIIDINEAFSRLTGYSRAEVLGKNPRILKSGRQDQAFYAAMWQELIEAGHWYGEVWNRRKSGEVYAEMLTISAVRDAQGQVKQYVALFSDITSLKEHESQLEHIAHYDALTALPNRMLLADRLHQAMAQALRRKQHLLVIYLDLDGFKFINDSHGHDAGDQLLMSVANRMKQTLREGDTLARLGGDEFVAVLLDLEDETSSLPMLNRLLSAAAKPVLIDGRNLQVSASIGVTVYPQEEEVDADQLLRQADQAMYQAKLAGKNRYQFFDTAQDRHLRGHHESLERMRQALNRREFVLYYQPKVNMRTGMVIGAEALIRWQHPENGLLPPAAFLPVIEDHPLAVEVGEWVIDSALSQMAAWHAMGLEIPVSVNISAYQLQQPDFIARLHVLLAQHPEVPAAQLELEVLETSALEDLVWVSQIIGACREIGVSFALDDFGTGYSSLTYLKQLPATQLKIDQSFVRDMLDDPDDLAILEGVLGLASAFRRRVIAEGVETLEHGSMLLRLGCDLAQGYGIARPMPAHDFPAWAAAWSPDPSWANLSAISREDLPLLFAGIEHRAWINSLASYLGNEIDTPPQLNARHCRFGEWWHQEGRSRYAARPDLLVIEALHQQIHDLAEALCTLRQRGQNSIALARLDELHVLQGKLLDALQHLVQESDK